MNKKKKEVIKNGDTAKKKNIITITLGILLTVVCFFALNVVNQRMTHPNGVADVVVALKDIEKGTVVDKDNINSYFKLLKDVDKTVVPNSSIKDLKKLDGVILKQDISKNEIVINSDLVKVNSALSKINSPTEVSIELDSIGNGVGGLLRKGDIVNILLSDNELMQSVPVLNNVYIDKGLTTNGVELKRDEKSSASIINIIIDEKDVATLETAKQKGNITFAKKN